MAHGLITVHEGGRELTYSFADLMKYHGPGSPGGVAHAFKVMERGFALLSPGAPLARQEIEIDTSFGGPGGRDAFEMVTRVVSREKYRVDKSLGDPWLGDGHREHYFFRLGYRGDSVTLIIEPGHVRDEFIALSRQPNRSAAEEERLKYLKQEMADRLLAMPAGELYAVIDKPQ